MTYLARIFPPAHRNRAVPPKRPRSRAVDTEAGTVLETVPVRGLSTTANHVYLRGWISSTEITGSARRPESE